jgi:hypothetical protein
MPRITPLILFAALCLVTLTSCSPSVIPTPMPTNTPTPPPPALGAGFRFSTYGPWNDPGPEYWVRVGQEMAAKFPGSVPEAIWIVANVGAPGSILTFPGSSENMLIHFTSRDRNEDTLTLFDQMGGRVWLQVEPGNAPVEELLRIVLERYAHHPCVVGVGVDVEWYHSVDEPEGVAVSDEEAAAWLAVAREYDPSYRLFLKHWEESMMPPTLRDGLLFVDDSQQFTSLDQMVEEFAGWGQFFAPAPVAFQFGYPDDQKWWSAYDDPPAALGQAILDRVPNTQGLYWVDFTVLEVFKP